MILRENDWGAYPNAVADLNTDNESFLKLCRIHKELKVKHWYMVTALHDKNLSGVDSHASNLDLETKGRIGKEMLRNFWFHCRQNAMVPQDGADPVRFRLNRGTFSLFWAFFNNVDIALLMIRQQGKSVALLTLIVYLLRVMKNSRTILLTRGSDLRTEHIDLLKKYRDSLPQYLWVHSKMDPDNTESFAYGNRNNKLITCIAQNNEDSARNAGRGMACGRVFSDETAFTKFIRNMLPAALASGTTARRIAEEEKIPYGNIFTTTPGKRDEPDGGYVYRLFHGGYFWDELLLDIPSRDELIGYIDTNCTGDRTMIHAPFTHRQLGMTDLELYRAMSNADGTPEEKMRDFGLRWTAGSLTSPLTVDELERVNQSQTTPKHTELFRNGYMLKWYYEPHEMDEKMKTMHVIGLDTSEGVGRDNIALTMINSETLETAATSTIGESNLIIYGNWLADILIKYPKTVLVIERKSSAPGMVDALLLKLPAAGIDPARRMYNLIIQDRDDGDKDLMAFQRIGRAKDDKFYEPYRKYFGFRMDGTARDTIYSDTLKNAVKVAGHLVRDRTLASELLALVVKNQRIDHRTNTHDDTVISWLMACWFMFYGRRLDHYGISNRKLMRRQWVEGATDEEFDDDEFEREEEEQRALGEEIDELCTQISSNRNPFLKITLERQLRIKLAQLKLDTTQAATIAELQDLLRNEKMKTRYLS